MNTAGKPVPIRSRPALSRDEILHQISALLDRPEDDLHAALMRELLTGLLKLHDAHLDLLDVKIVNRAVKELRHAFGVFHGYRERRKVSIFGSARTLSDDPNYQLAYQFAHAIVREGFMVITGGADGIMRAAQEGAGRENSFGVNIMLPFEQGPNSTIAEDPKLITFKYFFTRKLMFQKEATPSRSSLADSAHTTKVLKSSRLPRPARAIRNRSSAFRPPAATIGTSGRLL